MGHMDREQFLVGLLGLTTGLGSGLGMPHQDEEILIDTATTAGWSAGARVEDTGDAKVGGKALSVAIPADAPLTTVAYDLGTKREATARSQSLHFWYRVTGVKPETLHIKLIAAPLASGYQAIYSLPVPELGVWTEARIPVQQYQGPWGMDNKPILDSGSFQFRIQKPKGQAMTISVGAIRRTPLPGGATVNARAENDEIKRRKDLVKPMVTADVARNLPPHPRLLFTAKDLPAIRKRATDTEWGKTFVSDLTQRCEAELKKPVTLPDRGGQWYHWYACPKHGTRLKAESPTRHVCPTGGEVYTGYPYDDVYISTIHDGYSNRVRELGVLYQITGEKKYSARAREILLAYAAKYRSYEWHDKDGNKNKIGGGRVGPQTLDEATWLIPMAQGCDAIWDTLSPADIEAVKTGLFYPAATEIIQVHKMGIHNIQCWKNSAVGMVGFLFGDAALMGDAIDNVDRGMQAQVLDGITDDGPWYEGAWGYHFYTMNALLPLTEAAHNAGLPVYSGPLGERYRSFYLAPLMMALPDGRLPAFNDSTSATANGQAAYEAAFARWNDPRLTAAIRTGNRRTLQALITGTETLPEAKSLSFESTDFPASGYAFLRQGAGPDATTLVLKYGPHGGGHGHPDKLNVVLFMAGQTVLDDPGITTYGVPVHMGWYRTTLAHNTLTVDEESQTPTMGKLLVFQHTPKWSAALADAGPIYNGIQFRRAVFLLGPNLVVGIDLARATDGQTHQFDFALHPSFARPSEESKSSITLPNKPGYSYVRDAQESNMLTGTHYNLNMEGSNGAKLSRSFSIVALTPSNFSLITGTGVGKNTEDRVPIYLARFQNNHAAISWTVQLENAPSNPNVQQALIRATPIEVTDTAGKTVPKTEAVVAKVGGWLIVVNPAGKEIRAEGYTGKDKLTAIPIGRS